MGAHRSSATLQKVLNVLSANGPSSVADLMARVETTQATLWRLVDANPERLVKLGRARATRVAARREIAGLSEHVPVYRVDASGASEPVGALHPVAPSGHLFEGLPAWSRLYGGLPWFLQGMRPAGFLGRMVPRQHSELGFPADIRDWTSDQILVWLARFAHDVPGDLIVGDEALQRHVDGSPVHPVPREDRERGYLQLAETAMRSGHPGSSGGGEQPKFLATRQDDGQSVPVLVKFSPPMEGPVQRRVADLLRLEALALEVAAQHGQEVAVATILEGGGRVFLEVERFDRLGAAGRRGVVPLDVLDDEHVGRRQSWTDTALDLHTKEIIADADLERVLWLDRFGAFIGNTDRHGGNLSFFLEEGRVGPLTPLYDMLPMAWMPRSGELVETTLPLPALTPLRGDLWWSAWLAALVYWERAMGLKTISAEMRAIAEASHAALFTLEPRLARLPRARAAV